MNQVCQNGEWIASAKAFIPVDNKSYRYGDGLFETMKVWNGHILLAGLHFHRFFSGLKMLEYEIPEPFTPVSLSKQILHLCEVNGCMHSARVRLSASRGNGGILDRKVKMQYLIECWPLSEEVNKLNEAGLRIDLYPDARKSCDKFSNIKSANFLPYIMAAEYSHRNNLNDCLVLNTHGRIADSVTANVFLVMGNDIMTPSLDEGCVSGVTRRFLIEQVIPKTGMTVQEKPVYRDDLLLADEIFLSNAIQGVRWVQAFRDMDYASRMTSEIHRLYLQTITI